MMGFQQGVNSEIFSHGLVGSSATLLFFFRPGPQKASGEDVQLKMKNWCFQKLVVLHDF